MAESTLPEGWHLSREVSLGHILTTLAITGGLIGQFVMMQAKNAEQDRNIARVELLATQNASGLSSLQEVVGRMDERTQYMVATLDRIERRQGIAND